VTTESRERAEHFYDCELENKHVYDCQLCAYYHVVDDNADAFHCPIRKRLDYKTVDMETAVIFHPNE